MKPIMTKEECEVVKREYHRLLSQGYHPKAARRIVCASLLRVLKKRGFSAKDIPFGGLGQEEGAPNIIAQAADIEAIKAARETVSPWLWILSIFGFVMTTLNTRRIAKMFKSWKLKRRSA